MVVQATTFVLIVCSNASRIRSWNDAKSRCQTGSLALMEIYSAWLFSDIQRRVAPHVAIVPPGQATSSCSAVHHA